MMTGDHDEIAALTPVLPCTHIWVRKGLGSGTSESTTIWGAATCVLCGAMQSDSPKEAPDAR